LEHTNLQKKEGIQSIKNALNIGYRMFDTAAKYDNEKEVGKAINESGVDRKEIIITTKLWRENLGYEEAKKAFNISLKKPGLDYIDLYLIYWPVNAKNYKDWQ